MQQSDSPTVNHVLIAGGGTAGWITACKLACELNSKDSDGVQVTVVESPDIPIIGVGEGTWPTMRKTLEALDIDEADFIRECDATFKQATKFVNWRETPKSGEENHYFHLFGSVFNPEDMNLAPYWKLGLAGDISYAEAVGTQWAVCEQNLAPKKITTPAYQGLQNYAYHLNAGKFSDFLARHGRDKLGVKHIKANIDRVNLNGSGDIDSIDTDREGRLHADLFIDCTGSRALLLGEALQVPFKNINDILPNDTAIAIQVPYESEQQQIRSYTRSTAQECGWIWDIGLQHRRGIGHVYSSAHTSHERAETLLRKYAGPVSEGIEARRINMQIGYREKYWHKNCLAIGKSAAFIEPLEASAIFLIEAAGNMLCDQFPRNRANMPAVERKFNRSFHFRWQKSIEFIKMHYMLSKRDDTAYWIDSRNPDTCPDNLLELMEQWLTHPPSKYDFDNVFEPFVLESYQFVFFGMGAQADYAYNRSSFAKSELAVKKFDQVRQATQAITRELPGNRDLLNKILKHGLSKV